VAEPSKRDLLTVQAELIERLDLEVELLPNKHMQLSNPKVKPLDFRIYLHDVIRLPDPDEPIGYLFAVGTSKAPPTGPTHLMTFEQLIEVVEQWNENYKLAEHNRQLAKRGISKV
jgi:hypothetical protein